MHAGIVALILFWMVGVAPAARAYMEMEAYYKRTNGASVIFAVLYAVFWPASLIATLAFVVWHMKKTGGS